MTANWSFEVNRWGHVEIFKGEQSVVYLQSQDDTKPLINDLNRIHGIWCSGVKTWGPFTSEQEHINAYLSQYEVLL